ncbi:hypothetical protein PRIPAC_97407 [Pristionchus pacificus]|uniref:Uncharacterized protein n=1 Tax=Pristionchus pacificus TaxID=54126 RepID=A0A2A6BK06_PRIPA|nr:hypothetical protein PRIPAC_97407 [Pristionchus pacificus]|eukprot:PDM66121.1 hypothetical protein PRIPAC_45346 [Pristionchus pacificus]
MNYKALLLIVVLFIIWAEYEELSNSLTHPEEAASSTAKFASAAPQSIRLKSPSKSETSKTRKRKSSSKEEDLKEMLIQIMFQVFLLRGMRRKLVAPGTPADAALIVASMMLMICLMCIVWFAFIIGVVKAIELIYGMIETYRETHAENHERELEMHEIEEAHVEHEIGNPTNVVVRRGRLLRQNH